MRRFFNKKGTSILVGIVTVVIFALIIYNKPHRNIEDVKPDFTVNANDLLRAFEANSTDAESIYFNKVVEVNGVIKSKSKTDVNRSVIVGDAENFFGINCSFNLGEKERIDEIKTGSPIVVKGECKGYLDDVILVNCFLVEDKKTKVGFLKSTRNQHQSEESASINK